MYRDDEYSINYDDYNQNINNVNDEFNNNEYNDEYSYDDKTYYGKDGKKIRLYGIIGIILIVLLIILLVSCSRQKKNSLPSIEINGNERYIKIAERIDLDVKLVNNSNSNVSWRTLDNQIADVDSQGIVVGVGLGKTSIEASYKHQDNKEYLDSCIINVYQGDIGVDLLGISLGNEITVKIGETKAINVKMEPNNSYVDSIIYKIKDESIATIDNNGNITGVKAGETNLEVVVNNKYSKTVKVIVYSKTAVDHNNDNNDNMNSKPTGIEFIEKKVSIMVNEEKLLAYRILPAGARGTVIFNNSNNTVLKINNNGKVKGLSIGKTIVTATIGDKIKATIEVNVNPYIVPVENIDITSPRNIMMTINNTSQILYKVLPNYASNKTVVFKSSNESVAIVDTNGLIKSIGSGTCVITAITVDGNKQDTINVTVN